MSILEKNLNKIHIDPKVTKTIENFKLISGTPKIEKVCDSVYVAINYGMGSVIIFDTEEGLVIVDTSDSRRVARKIKADLGELLNKPVKKIIYTHCHGDHWMGTAEFVCPDTDVIAHREFMDWLEYGRRLKGKDMRQNILQYNFDLPVSHRHIKIIPDKPGDEKLVLPNLLVDDCIMFSLGGLDFKIYHIECETSDHLMVWVPQLELLCCGDLYYASFPNISSPMKIVRSAYKWYKSLEQAMLLEPRYLVPSHTEPIKGKEKAAEVLRDYRDAVKFIDDEVVKALNKGKTLEEMRSSITSLPEHLANKSYLLELYGKVSWAVEGVFRIYSGWFEGNPTWLEPLPAKERNTELIDMAGGPEKILMKAAQKQDEDLHQLALELCEIVISVQPDNQEALEMKIFSLQALGLNTFNSNARAFYLGEAARISQKLGLLD
ncbi:alkyl sulfatase dimerization domain-containing protein [Desulfosporosinus metallidurans]|uniref:Alkyl sulfatase or beta-lactamase n=1 Tax=Desulfosporosinus metallidurans TaxID=1888891 RepID=A0A1Q8QHY3_9FIRM|nr:alkyl sulfatase dimerization domain-containing protein [Desulfosporosinus metallidurans]OLN26959.1 Alkyl sulfatase or beta-lactamase [Desulfosporosinus metallidurans]